MTYYPGSASILQFKYGGIQWPPNLERFLGIYKLCSDLEEYHTPVVINFRLKTPVETKIVRRVAKQVGKGPSSSELTTGGRWQRWTTSSCIVKRKEGLHLRSIQSLVTPSWYLTALRTELGEFDSQVTAELLPRYSVYQDVLSDVLYKWVSSLPSYTDLS